MRGASDNCAAQLSLTRRSKSRAGLSPHRERQFNGTDQTHQFIPLAQLLRRAGLAGTSRQWNSGRVWANIPRGLGLLDLSVGNYLGENIKVVIIGANGTMGSGAGCVFASAGYRVTMLARSRDKAAAGLTEVQNDARAEAIAERIALGSYDGDLAKTVGDAAIVFEALAEDLPLKKQFFELVDKSRRPHSISAP